LQAIAARMPPLVSIVVPTRNRADELRQALKALLDVHAQTAQVELIVVDNGSTDNTWRLLQTVSAREPGLQAVREPRPGISHARNAGIREARADVLVYTSDPFDEALELIGPVSAELYVDSSLDHADFFVRVCDVDPDGKSVNVCDGLQRFDPSTIDREGDGGFRAEVRLWPIGHRFAPGHRLRIQVSSGAHPVYARNLGTGEPPARATAMQAADQTVFHDAERPSSVTLPHFPG